MTPQDQVHFIADLHLDPARPALSQLFQQYLAGPARHARALYILGDLFEVWAGDEVSLPLYQSEIQAIRALSDSGVAVYFICGNRDFLCGESFARAAGLELLTEPQVLQCGASNVVALHGDSLCTDDRAYQRFRRIVRSRWVQALYSLLPLSTKARLVSRIRSKTRQATRLKATDIMDVNADAVEDLLQRHPACPLMIHGHTHRPADHQLGNGRHRLVLADWHDTRGEYLCLRQDGWQRHPISTAA